MAVQRVLVAAALNTLTAFEDIFHEAHEQADDSPRSTLALIVGIVLYDFTSAILSDPSFGRATQFPTECRGEWCRGSGG